ncbi:MAG: glycerate kinase [Burkholderiales bacterium]
MRIVLAPDSFKGSLSAPDVCAALGRGIARALPGAQIVARPMADGGEGTLDAVLAAVGAAGRRHVLAVHGAGGAPVDAAYGEIGDGAAATAVIEVAQVVGITDARAMAVPVADRSTRGVGEMIVALLDRGVRRFMIGLGGSSTNDGGSGMLAALGLALADRDGRPVAATPRALAALARVDAARVDARLAECEIRIMSDVNNPLCGDLGATAIFGPQKGVTPAEAPVFDAALAHFAEIAEAAVGRRAAHLPGAGAAGGLGFALQLVGGTFASGAAVVADLIGLDAALAGADWAITGEGRTDRQTLLAKAPFVVAQRAAAARVPVTLVSGAVDAASLPELSRHFAGCFALPNGPATLADCIAGAAALLEARAEQAARVFAAGRGRAAAAVK